MLSAKDIKVVQSILGDDIFQTLEKSEISGGLYKPGTRTALDPEEIKIALEIVPRTILSFLMGQLKNKEVGEICKCDLPFEPGAMMECHKLGPDNYSGQIIKDGKVCAEFKHRSIPGVGLIILTAFELYDISNLDRKKASESDEKIEKLQDIINQKLELQRLVQDVVDRRMSERAAIDSLIQARLGEHIASVQAPTEEKEEPTMEKKSKLKQFLESREGKRQESVEMEKGEINCPDCGTNIYKNEKKNEINLCLCYGEHMNKGIKFKKSEDGRVQFKFPKSFDIENVEMLLDAIKKQ